MNAHTPAEERDMSNIIQMGHNNPPNPFDEIKQEIEGLYEEAKNWCDGEAIASQETADQIDKLVAMIKDAAKRAEALRKDEVKPYNDELTAIQTKFNELIGNTKTVKGIAVSALEACNSLLTPWKQKLEAERQEKLKAEREAAEAAAKKAAEELQRSQGNLEAKAKAEEQIRQAKELGRQANRTNREKVKGMRTVRNIQIVDANKLARWFWERHREDLEAFMLEKVTQYDRAGERSIPGIEVKEEKVAR